MAVRINKVWPFVMDTSLLALGCYKRENLLLEERPGFNCSLSTYYWVGLDQITSWNLIFLLYKRRPETDT